jgi:4-hydroxybenzoate polyprenyltransferase
MLTYYFLEKMMHTMLHRLKAYYALARLDRPTGNFLLLWPTLWAVWLASDGWPDTRIVLIFVFGVALMRAAGSAINDIADRHIDGKVARTKDRPLAKQQLSVTEAIVVSICLLAVALWLVLKLNTYAQSIAVVGAILTVLYPFSKRYLPTPQYVLGLVFSLGVLMAFAAIQNRLPVLAWLLYLTSFLLTVAFDTLYAFCDRKYDIQIGINSTAIYYAKWDRLFIALLHLGMIGLLLYIGYFAQLKWYYYPFIGLAGATLLFQQWLVRHYDEKLCLIAFKNNQLTGLLIFIGFVLGSLK